MSCCGGKRRQFPTGMSRRTADNAPKPSFSSPQPTDVVSFAYTGRTGLTVRGPVTGRLYRFGRPGAEAAVDKRDAPALTAVPNLKRLPPAA